ncbi:ABC transporter ATP-binding protein [Enterococcus florum]|uniref:ABC transporter ATP-binding protein n=1 Tax=Enterococcus florum TaxID=2480627 RepID=A0A4P5P9C1_9ENTE|nr:ABC transporter ATP-binding protein [Enterococcus florum]GCF94156.1 ABC transporter ATP-binding protein [Enterococcus florum]
MKTMIKGIDISKFFGEGIERVQVLNQVDLQVKQGEFVSIMGASGSGKSTLLYAISGMDSVDTGEIVFDDHPLQMMSERELADLRRKDMGFVFQQPTLLKNLSLLDNILLPSLNDKKRNQQELEKQAHMLMERVGIAELKERRITQVSGGQLQRAGICRALMSRPSVVFGDEPTGALNSKAAQEILDILSKINQEGTTVVLVTHDAKVAAQSERVLLMADGRIVDELVLGSFSGQQLERRMERINQKMLAAEI